MISAIKDRMYMSYKSKLLSMNQRCESTKRGFR